MIEPIEASLKAMTADSDSQHKSILVVEDDIQALEALTALLESSGYTVARAQNGREALSVLGNVDSQPCLILLDLSMPVMDGWEFLRSQRSQPAIASIPVIVITALVSAVPAGAKGLVTKPIDVSRLLTLVQRYC
ncbi:MAG TPA: response regulator [Candidatus Binataceae bacterium]|nr:response regulator [Candidatus Binataceae bacterium]